MDFAFGAFGVLLLVDFAFGVLVRFVLIYITRSVRKGI